MSDGLGMRYAFLGMFETAHLNAAGFSDYCDRFSKAWFEVSKTFKPAPIFEGPRVQNISEQLETEVSLNKLQVSYFDIVLR